MTRVSLLRTCVADAFSPGTARSATRLLEAAGCEVSCPSRQTCCGQPAWNAGFTAEAARVARTTLAALEADGADAVVVPSGSCATMVTHYWPELFHLAGDEAAAARARAVAGHTHELTGFLARHDLPALDLGGEGPVVAVHQSCHALREMGVGEATTDLVDRIAGCTTAAWSRADAERCCGFGGAFSAKLPETAEAMADVKLATLTGTGAEVVVGTDLSCLMHMRARSLATGSPVEIRHVADLATDALGPSRPRRATPEARAPMVAQQPATHTPPPQAGGPDEARAPVVAQQPATHTPPPQAGGPDEQPAEARAPMVAHQPPTHTPWSDAAPDRPSERSAAVDGPTLRARTATAVADPVLRRRLAKAVDRFADHRAHGLAELEDADGLRRAARAVKGALLADLPAVLEQFADAALAAGAHVHWAPDGEAADAAVAAIVLRAAADRPEGALVVKSKSMATEEIGLNRALAAAGCEVVETDLGEWIVQLADERPSHIIAPAVHHDRHSIRATFRSATGATDEEAPAVPEALNRYARNWLRPSFLNADVGITGANFGVAESGSIVLVTNEGNGRLVTSIPRVHVVVLGMERVVRTWDQLDLLLTLLTRSATGQRLTSYTSVVTGPRRPGEHDGPEELHVVVLDNGRSALLAGEYHEMLACIRCGACLNACPVYRQVGGHAYGGVYSGPMGAVLTPLLEAERPGSAETPDASTLCGACMQACPVEIPLQDLLLSLRRRNAPDAGRATRAAWRAWSETWSRPAAYRASLLAASAGRGLVGPLGRAPALRRLTAGRVLPRPASMAERRAVRGGRRG